MSYEKNDHWHFLTLYCLDNRFRPDFETTSAIFMRWEPSHVSVFEGFISRSDLPLRLSLNSPDNDCCMRIVRVGIPCKRERAEVSTGRCLEKTSLIFDLTYRRRSSRAVGGIG